jgi:endonuclease/exonuclease/phosphatase family metal-dependent hydrolase
MMLASLNLHCGRQADGTPFDMPGPVSGLAVGYSPAVNGRTYPAHRPLLQLDQMLTSGAVRASDGRVLPPVGSDHVAIRARLRVV